MSGFPAMRSLSGCSACFAPQREYAQLAHAFETLIGPHIDRNLARKLHKSWLPPVTTKPKAWPGTNRASP
jgi:hypothetical protein